MRGRLLWRLSYQILRIQRAVMLDIEPHLPPVPHIWSSWSTVPRHAADRTTIYERVYKGAHADPSPIHWGCGVYKYYWLLTNNDSLFLYLHAPLPHDISPGNFYSIPNLTGNRHPETAGNERRVLGPLLLQQSDAVASISANVFRWKLFSYWLKILR